MIDAFTLITFIVNIFKIHLNNNSNIIATSYTSFAVEMQIGVSISVQ